MTFEDFYKSAGNGASRKLYYSSCVRLYHSLEYLSAIGFIRKDNIVEAAVVLLLVSFVLVS